VWRAQADPASCGYRGRSSRRPFHDGFYFLEATTVPPTIFSQEPFGT
jgi:hypothetical protein